MSILDGELSLSDFVVFNTYLIQIYLPLHFLGTFWRFIRQNWADIELVLDIFEVTDRIDEDKNPLKVDVHTGEIEFKNVSFTYDSNLPDDQRKMIIEDLTFKIPGGSSVALVGATGAGKSTIMRLLYRFYDLTSGSISIDG